MKPKRDHSAITHPDPEPIRPPPPAPEPLAVLPQQPSPDPYICPHCEKPLINIEWRTLVTPTNDIVLIAHQDCRKVIGTTAFPPKQSINPFNFPPRI